VHGNELECGSGVGFLALQRLKLVPISYANSQHHLFSKLEENEVINFLSSDFLNTLEVSLFLLLGLSEHAFNTFLKFKASGTGISVHDFRLEHRSAEIFKFESEG
jgi:hypothetical protein